jgi:hypothetical protein
MRLALGKDSLGMIEIASQLILHMGIMSISQKRERRCTKVQREWCLQFDGVMELENG